MLVTGLLLPYYKMPQRITDIGPRVEPYIIMTHLTPPIDKGAPISLDFLSDKPGATTLLLASFDSDTQTIDIPPVLHVAFDPEQKEIVFYSRAPKTASYLLMITSYNSSFRFTLNSVWSPFYEYRSATVFGIIVLLLGIVSVYYCEYAERKEQMFKKALSGIHDPYKA